MSENMSEFNVAYLLEERGVEFPPELCLWALNRASCSARLFLGSPVMAPFFHTFAESAKILLSQRRNDVMLYSFPDRP